jgi:hypothetical protein
METVLNYTNRNDKITISGDDPEVFVKVAEKNNNLFFYLELNIKKNKYPGDSRVYLQAYSVGGYVAKPVDCGTIDNPKKQNIFEPNISADQVRFRFKIVENSSGSIKKILCFKDQIKPWSESKNTLLNIGEGKIDSIYEINVEPDNKPSIIFKAGLGIKSDLLNSNYLKGIIFTAALREILLKYIIEAEKFIDCKFKKDYSKHFQSLLSEDFPDKFVNDDQEIYNWINRAVASFSNHFVKKNKSLISIMPSSEVSIEEKLTYTK